MVRRALVAFLALPGVVAFAVPCLVLALTGRTTITFPFGFVVLALGTVLLFWCVRDFYVAGRGTLAPWDPAQELVVVGLYRFSRNPMYLAVLAILLGWTITFGSWLLLGYLVLVAIGFHLRVVRAEEPALQRTFGEAWQDYAARVPRWIGRVQ